MWVSILHVGLIIAMGVLLRFNITMWVSFLGLTYNNMGVLLRFNITMWVSFLGLIYNNVGVLLRFNL